MFVKCNRLFFVAMFLGCCGIPLSLSAQQSSSGSLPPGMSLGCQFTSGPRSGQFEIYMGIPDPNPALVGSSCTDGQGSTGVTQMDSPSPGMPLTWTCRFNNGPRSGTSIDFKPSGVRPFALGSSCTDSQGSYGVAVSQGRIGASTNGGGGSVTYNPAKITTSRGFTGPNQFPPKSFASYGIIAFPSRASSHDIDRHLMICEAYVTALPHSNELVGVPPDQQMITVWPVNSDDISSKLNENSVDVNSMDLGCDQAVKNYGLLLSKQALKEAKIVGVNTSGSGPYLLAWSPADKKGKKDALVLVSDLSDVTTYQQAQAVFRQWINDIQQDPNLWKTGWNMEKLRVKIRFWADMYGPRMLAVFSGK
jgi:hypothetical protein